MFYFTNPNSVFSVKIKKRPMMMMQIVVLFSNFSFTLAAIISLSLCSCTHRMCVAAADTINYFEMLRDTSNDTLVSSRGSFELGFFSPENSSNRYVGIWYNRITPRTVVWVANRDTPLTDTSGVLQFTRSGLSLLQINGSIIIWSANSSASSTVFARLLNSGNLVVLTDADDDDGDGDDDNPNPGSFLWQSFDYPTDTLLPGMKLGKIGLHEVYTTSWKSTGDPAPGDFTLHFDPTGYPQLTIKNGPVPVYKSGPWNGLGFSGLPILKNNTIFAFGVVINSNEVYYHYELLNESVITRLTISESGVGQRWIWIDRTQEWIIYISLPVDNCDVYKACGPYGSCNPARLPLCRCLRKFKARDPQGWDGGDYTNGCVRNKPLSCRNGDGFLKYTGIKLPDTQYSWYNETMTLEECSASCSRNCSCSAYSRLNLSSGNGCLLWFGDLVNMRDISPGHEVYIRMASSELDSGKKRKRIAMALLVGILLLSLCLGLFLYFQKRKRRSHHHHQLPQIVALGLNYTATYPDESHSDLEIPRFELLTLSNATDNFSSNNMLGEGGYGTVYKGVLGDGQEIAVKCSSRTSLQGIDAFMNEVRSIAKLQHRNLVKLVGCCIQGEERILVYEYLANKSLDLMLFDSTKRVSLDWPRRFSIINSIARGLQYLHEDSRLRVIHRDLKTSNILLDSDMNPKISDFGLARTFGGNETGDITCQLMGTHGYIAPEYLGFGQFSVKSDVYSFGVIVLEIASGERNRGFHRDRPAQNLLGHAWMLYGEEKLEELVDPCLGRRHLLEITRSIRVGLLCVQEHPDDRPSMSSVIVMLGNDGDVLPQPIQPRVFTERHMPMPTTHHTNTTTQYWTSGSSSSTSEAQD